MKTKLTVALVLLALTTLTYAAQTDIAGPPGSGSFGTAVTVLPNGNIVVTDPLFDKQGPTVADVGAVYLFSPTGTLISTLTGSTANDQVGSGGINVLPNGSYLVISLKWHSSAADSFAGAVTWCDAATGAGVSTEVSAANSLVGGTANDQVGAFVTILTNGNYVVCSPGWDNTAASAADAGAATLCNGTTGTSGAVSAANSLVGTTPNDNVGFFGAAALTNGNYVIRSPHWDDASAGMVDAGAVTWASGATGITGPVTTTNSLHGSTATNSVGGAGVYPLTNGNYVVNSPDWDNTSPVAANAGAVTWCNGSTGRTGPVTAANSLVGTTANDQIGEYGIVVLTNGNYVVRSPDWDNTSPVMANVGAATWGSGTTGISGPLSSANSLIGGTANDAIDGSDVVALNNGNYVVCSEAWHSTSPVAANVGAATWCNGSTGLSGVVTATNSLVGGSAGDTVGSGGVTVLTNSHYIVISAHWKNTSPVAGGAGAATWGSGTAGITGLVSAANSLVGSTVNDQVGLDGVVALTNGNYVVSSRLWDKPAPSAVADVGAVTWGNGSTGSHGAVSAANSLVGTATGDHIGDYGVTPLTNGNYVAQSQGWDNGSVVDAGSASWGNGSTGTFGAVSTANSLVGTKTNDLVGSSFVYALSNGNYVVCSENWSNPSPSVSAVGAATWGDGTTGTFGAVTAANSLIGSSTNDNVGDGGARALSDGNYVVHSFLWRNGSFTNAGAMTMCGGLGTTVGPITASNSVRGAFFGGGSSLVSDYDATRKQLVVGQPSNNILSLFGLAPEIAVAQPLGTDLTSGVSVIDYGNAGVTGSGVVRTFTITNTGDGPLSVSDVVMLVGDTGSFTIDKTGMSNAIAAGGSTTFTVTFSPLSLGSLNAVLEITSDDADEGSFDINLTGTGVAAPGSIAFTKTVNFVNEEAGTVNIPLTRSGGSSGSVSVLVNSAPGSATLSDYNIVSNVLVTFADNELTQNVPVTILPDALNEPNEDFTLTLSSPTGGVAIGTPSTTIVRIVEANDTTKPTVTMTAPAANANISEGTAVSVTGSATDGRGVKVVQFSLNNAAFADAPTTLNATGLSATYVKPLALVPGPNTIAVQSIDTRNNMSAVVTRTINYNVVRPLTVNVVGVANSSTLTAPFPGTDSTKKAGFTYIVTATPKPGYVFDGWTANDFTGTGVTPAMQELPALTFKHQTGLVLAAHFIVNPFNTSLTGNFNGLILPSGGTVALNETAGSLTATLSTTGSITGTAKIDGFSLPFKGVCDNAGDARFGATRSLVTSLTRTGKAPLELSLHADLTGTTDKLTGTLIQKYRSTTKYESAIDADRKFFNGTTSKVPSQYAGTKTKPYTARFPARTTQGAAFTSATYPQGDGYATMTVNINGTVTLSGKLADNTGISMNAGLSKLKHWPIFQQLYANKGSLIGLATLDDSPTDTDAAATNVLWFRPFQSVQWYPYGWNEGIYTDFFACKYTPSPTAVFLGLNPTNPLLGNTDLTFTSGLLTSTVTKFVNLTTANVLSKAPTTDTSFTFVPTFSTGMIAGTFTHTNGTKPAWQGVLMQKGANTGGFGYFMIPQPKLIDFLGESGRLTWVKK